MSATGRGRPRDEHDFYETPDWCVYRLLEAVDLPGGAWVEPGAGSGAIIRAVTVIPPKRAEADPIHWTAIEIDDRFRERLTPIADNVVIGDIRSVATTSLVPGSYDVAIGNPPYRQAQEFVEWALLRASWVAMLLRVGFLEGQKRNDLLRRFPPDIYILPNRPSFKYRGTDATTYAWMVWRPSRGASGATGPHGRCSVLALTPRGERIRRK